MRILSRKAALYARSRLTPPPKADTVIRSNDLRVEPPMKTILLFAVAFAFSAAATAQQYKWTDQNGRVQYGDAPPPGVKATPLRSVPGPAAQPDSKAADAKGAKGPMTAAEREANFRKRQQEASKDREKQAQATEQAEAKKENCQR